MDDVENDDVKTCVAQLVVSQQERDANVAGMQGNAMRGLWMDNGYGQKHRNIETNNRKTWKPKYIDETLPKAQRTRGLSSSCQSNFLKSYHNFTNLDQISSSESGLKNQLLNQTSASPMNLKIKIWTKHSFRIATKIQLHNL